MIVGIICMSMIANLQYGWTLFVNPIADKHGWTKPASWVLDANANSLAMLYIGTAVVLREGHTADERELRAFAAVRLADFKVPRKILIVKEIPVGATGKLQRIGLAAKLGLG